MGSGVLSAASRPGQRNSSGDGPQAGPTSIILSSLSPVADASDVPAGASLAADASPPTSICDDLPVGTTNINSGGLEVVRLLNGKLKLPAPKQLSNRFSGRRMELREKAADLALRLSNAPGVRKAKLDAPVFTALVHRESGFEPHAVSPVGARGLGQLTPSTARAIGMKDSFAPAENLIGVATHVTDTLDQFGSPEVALVAYNAGPGPAEKYCGIPPHRGTRQNVADIFHEVLPEPHPLYVTARLTQPKEQPNVNVLLTALTAEKPAPVEQDTFSAVPKETSQQAEAAMTIQFATYAGTRETAIRPQGTACLRRRGPWRRGLRSSLSDQHRPSGRDTTIYADSPKLNFDRLALMVMPFGVPMSHGEIIQYAKKTINLVVQVECRHVQSGVLEVYTLTRNPD